MVREKQVQALAKKMATLIGKMDLEIKKQEVEASQEAVNKKISRDLLNKYKKKD